MLQSKYIEAFYDWKQQTPPKLIYRLLPDCTPTPEKHLLQRTGSDIKTRWETTNSINLNRDKIE